MLRPLLFFLFGVLARNLRQSREKPVVGHLFNWQRDGVMLEPWFLKPNTN